MIRIRKFVDDLYLYVVHICSIVASYGGEIKIIIELMYFFVSLCHSTFEALVLHIEQLCALGLITNHMLLNVSLT